MSTLAAPRNVSPFIRFSRWSLLLGGILYGSYRYRSLSAKEVKIQEVENKIRTRRDARLAAEQLVMQKEELNALAKEVGVPVRD